MTLLEVVQNAVAFDKPLASESDHPIVLNPDDVFPNLKPKLEPDLISLAVPFEGWEMSENDSKLIDLDRKHWGKLKSDMKVKLKKSAENQDRDKFIRSLNSILEEIGQAIGISSGVDSANGHYTRGMIEKLGHFIGKDVASAILETCVTMELWELVETFTVSGFVNFDSYSGLVTRLMEMNRPDILCLCIKHASDLKVDTIFSILKYFLRPPKDAYDNMLSVRKEWESQALLAVEMATDKNIKGNKKAVAKEASILLMIANDGFSSNELCLHYLLASPHLDEAVLAYALSRLTDKEMASLVRYLGKWLKKYERFPQAIPCPEASSMIGLKVCDWIPKLEDVARRLGVVLDENFSSLVLNPEFHEELRSMERTVSSLASEARLCCSVAYVAEKLRR